MSAPKPSIATSQPSERRKLTICVVDDDDMYRDFLERLLVGSNHRVIAARGGDELQASLDNNHVDCIVLDYNLVAENGMEVYERLQKRPDKVPPVVMLTGTEGERVVIKAYRLGLDDFVLKRDLRASELVGAIERAVARHADEENRAAELEKLKRRSSFDTVTGLYSRQEIDQRLVALANSSDRRGGHFGVILSTINEIQSVTDQFGLVSGDRALHAAAARLQPALRSTDICGRYDDATFISLIDTNVTPELLQELCSRIDAALTFEFREELVRAGITSTIGFAVYPEDGDVPGELIESALRNFFVAPNGSAPAAGGQLGGRQEAMPAAAVAIAPAKLSSETVAGRQEERRRHPRQRVLKRGRIVLNNGNSTVDCTIRDISEGGARLRLGGDFAAPENFDLLFLESSLRRKVVRRWQIGTDIGVEFLD